jgi:hypothetical protein
MPTASGQGANCRLWIRTPEAIGLPMAEKAT